MATKKKQAKPKLTPAQRARLAEKAKKQWSDPNSKLRARHAEGQKAIRRKPPKHAVAMIKEACSKYGATLSTICELLQCCPQTLAGWRKTYPAIEQAIVNGRKIEEDRLWGTLFKQATVDENTTAAIVLLKMKFHHRDNGPVPGEKPESPADQAAKIRAALQAMRKVDGEDGGNANAPAVSYN